MKIKTIRWQDTLQIRHQVLWPNKSLEFCKVPGDESAIHYGVSLQGRIVSVASLYCEGEGKRARLRKFATLPEYQGQGIGSNLLTHIFNNLLELNTHYLWCDARKTAIAFYKRFGMQVEGEEFTKSGVVYFKMSKTFT